MKTLKQVRDAGKDTKKGKHLNAQVEKARRMDGLLSFDDVEVVEAEELGHDVAGDCDMCTKHMRIRRDLTDTESGIRKSVLGVLVHEGEHSRGNAMEGVTELVTTLKTGQAPVAAYVEKHRAAKHLASVIGTQELVDAARGRNAEVVIMNAFIKKQIEKDIHPKKAKAKAEDLVKKAA